MLPGMVIQRHRRHRARGLAAVVATVALAAVGCVSPPTDLLAGDDTPTTVAPPGGVSPTGDTSGQPTTGQPTWGDTAAARRVLDERTDPLEFDQEGYAQLGLCPLDADGTITDELFAGVEPAPVADALDDPTISDAFLFTVSLGAQVGCHRGLDRETGLGVVAMAAPTDVQRYVATFTAEVSGATAPEATVAEPVDHDGGRFHQFCVHYPDDPLSDFCELDWVDQQVLLGVYVAGPGADEVDAELLRSRLAHHLPALVSSLLASDSPWSRTA